MAKALQKAFCKLDHITPMWLDVINISGSDPLATLGALPAERLCQQLSGAAFRPVIARIRVQVMPGS